MSRISRTVTRSRTKVWWSMFALAPMAVAICLELGLIGCGTRKGPVGAMAQNTAGATEIEGAADVDRSSGTGGASASGGSSASDGAHGGGGASATDGGPANAGSLGVGGTTAPGGAPTGASGAESAGGGAGAGGRAPAGGTSVACPACQPHESCWSDSAGVRCIGRAVTVPGRFAIDVTEVTRGQYAAWLATHPATTGQPVACSWNTTFVPDPACMAKPSVCAGPSCVNHPQPCVDLCDATAYCHAIGRHLCPDESWTSACSSDGAYPASYGAMFIRNTCNDYTVGGETTVAVASKPACQTPTVAIFPGVFDMIGNVAEWTDSCAGSAGATDVCRPRGLSFGHGAAAPLCHQSTYAVRSAALDNLGFRCCGP